MSNKSLAKQKHTAYFFGVLFAVFGFEAVFAFGPGGPRLSHCFKYSISLSSNSNIALTPIYRFGLYPCLFNLCLVASDEMPPSPFVFSSRLAISKIVYSIPSLYRQTNKEQVVNVQKSDILTIFPYYKEKVCHFDPLYCVVLTQIPKIRIFTNFQEFPVKPLTVRWGSDILFVCPT